MTVFTDLLGKFSGNFDDKTYPTTVYFSLLERIKKANSSQELGTALSHMLAWKDGKVRLSNTGSELIEVTGLRYSVGRTKPNTFGPTHEEILHSEQFFDWAIKVRNINHFDANLINVLNERFGLWSTVVIPAFLLHCLNNRFYPILDRWVLQSYGLFKNGTNTKLTASIDNYIGYQGWWQQVLIEVYPNTSMLSNEQLKVVDASLWALGKYIYSLEVNSGVYLADASDLDELLNKTVAPISKNLASGTDSDAFKRRAVELSRSISQGKAIEQAAAEFEIDLSGKPSYLRYPGSHFDRWRKQGFI